MDSIMQTEKKCYLTGATNGLQCHHIFGGCNRKKSEKYGLKVWLKWDRHIENSPYATPHNDKTIDLMLKKAGQRKFEETHSREQFMQEFGRSWL